MAVTVAGTQQQYDEGKNEDVFFLYHIQIDLLLPNYLPMSGIIYYM